MRNTPCICDRGGWCERHQCEKSDRHVRMCQTDPRFFKLWEEKQGPGQLGPVRREFCRHMGQQVDELPCETCRGRVQIKLFACELYGKCSLSLKLASAQCCAVCPDYTAKVGDQAAGALETSPDAANCLFPQSRLETR